MLIGLGEAAITALVLAAVARLRPELMRDDAPAAGVGAAAVQGLVVALGLAIFVAPFACAWPDGLEKVAARLGFESAAVSARIVSAPMRDYAFPRFHRIGPSTAAAGAAGTLAAFVLSYLLARGLTKGK